MSVSSLSGAQKARPDSRCSAARQSGPSGLSFQERLARTAAGTSAAEGPPVHLRMPSETTVYSGAHIGRNGTMQEVYAEYTADSTFEDPIVRVSGVSDSGPYAFTCHIKDIDPSNASYAELAALFGHLVKGGAFQGGLSIVPDVVPIGLETGDIMERRDYLSLIDRHQYDRRFGSNCRAQAAELLAVYRPCFSGSEASRGASALDRKDFLKEDLLSALAEFQSSALNRMKKARENEEEQEAWDKLMNYLDAWIESLREEGDIRKITRAHAALAALQTDAASDRKDPGSELLERLKTLLV